MVNPFSVSLQRIFMQADTITSPLPSRCRHAIHFLVVLIGDFKADVGVEW